MDGTGEHYVKWNKPDCEGQIPYDLTFNWNIINRKKKDTNNFLNVLSLRKILKSVHYQGFQILPGVEIEKKVLEYELVWMYSSII